MRPPPKKKKKVRGRSAVPYICVRDFRRGEGEGETPSKCASGVYTSIRSHVKRLKKRGVRCTQSGKFAARRVRVKTRWAPHRAAVPAATRGEGGGDCARNPSPTVRLLSSFAPAPLFGGEGVRADGAGRGGAPASRAHRRRRRARVRGGGLTPRKEARLRVGRYAARARAARGLQGRER